MFIVWGTKIRRRRLGYRADFCRICRQVRPFKVEQIESVSHLYYVPLGPGTVHGYVKSCQSCAIAVDANVHDAKGCSRERRVDLADLIAERKPQIDQEWSGRFALEDKIKSRKLSAAEHESLILEPFLLLNPTVDGRRSGIHFDWLSGLAAAATVFVPFALLCTGGGTFHLSYQSFEKIVFAVGGLLIVLTIALVVTDRWRFARREIVPKLVTALHPLAPSADEITRTLEQLKNANLAIGKDVKCDDLINAIQFHSPVE